MKKGLKKLFFPVVGFLSLAWFLIRVIPKPSRANYPCMRVAFPAATSFVLYIAGLLSSVFVFKKAKKYLYQSRYALFAGTLLAGIVLIYTTNITADHKTYALTQSPPDGANNPMGVGQGINPGRVVWVHDPDATDENCTDTYGDYWYQDDNTSQDIVDRMVSDAIQKLTETETDAAAWDALFRYFNEKHGKGDFGYTAGEKIVVKLNFNGVSQGKDKINTSPQIAYTVLDQLINVVGVAQSDIGIGDPNINFDTPHWNKCESVFPDVTYWGNWGGRTPVEQSEEKAIFTSDGKMSDWLPQEYLDAAYMINIPVFKKHHRGGISLTSKLHFGSFTPFNGDAFHWHYSLPAPDGRGDVSNGEYGAYRCFVDIMGHKDMGDKTVLFLVDGLWSSINWGHPSIKWRMEPFNNDYPNSIFASQDPVAIQSVGFDFLYYEFDENHPTEGENDWGDNHGPFPHYAGSDDFLHQAADKANWAVTYDPENDGTELPSSLGVHEHWNNAIDKQYSRNLGADEGIELVYVASTSTVEDRHEIAEDFMLFNNYPNPFNPSTQIEYQLSEHSRVDLKIYNQMGQVIRTLVYNEPQDAGHHQQQWNGNRDNGTPAESGMYFCEMNITNRSGVYQKTRKMILSR